MKELFFYTSDIIEKYNGFKNLNGSDLFSLGFLFEIAIDRTREKTDFEMIQEFENCLFDVDSLLQIKGNHEEKNHSAYYWDIKRIVIDIIEREVN